VQTGEKVQKLARFSIKSDAGYAAENEGKSVPKIFLKNFEIAG